jgi:hypothetical protein
MSTQPEVETVSTGADKAKLAGAAVLLVGSIGAFYALSGQSLWMRVAVLLLLLAAAVALFFVSENGKQLAHPQGGHADDGLRVRIRVRDGPVPVAHRQDPGVGALRPDPPLAQLSPVQREETT